jgi:hypothetical protein
MVLTISWGAVVKLALVGAIIAFIKMALKCMHDKSCVICKPK